MAVDDAYTKILLHFNGEDESTTIVDEGGNTWVRNAWTPPLVHTVIDQAQFKFGNASLRQGGWNESLVLSGGLPAAMELGGGDFTIDFQMGFASLPASAIQFGPEIYRNSSNRMDLSLQVATESTFYFRLNARAGGVNLGAMGFGAGDPFTLEVDTWYHVELCRTGDDYKMFLEGVPIGTVAQASHTYSLTGADFSIYQGADDFLGWLDEFRYSVGIARHTSGFTPPDAEYAASGQPVVISAPPMDVRVELSAGCFAVLIRMPAAPLSVAAALSVGGIASFVDRDYIVRWRCTLEPFRGGLAGGVYLPGSTLPALALPMGSFQLRHTWDREEAGIAYWGSYLSAVIPGVELAEEIAARALPYDLGDGTIGRAKLRIYMVKEYRAGHEIAELIAEGDLDDVRSDVGPNSQSISISARAAASGSPKTIRLTDPQYYATYGGKKRYRMTPNLFFRCGDTALIGSDSLLAQDVTMYVGVDAGAVMEVSGT